MVIGRTDVILPIDIPAARALELAVRAASGMWPSAIVTDGDDTQTFDGPEAVPFDRFDGWMVFENPAVRADLRRHGPTPATAGRMFDFIAGRGELTVVVDDPSEATAKAVVDALGPMPRCEPLTAASPAGAART